MPDIDQTQVGEKAISDFVEGLMKQKKVAETANGNEEFVADVRATLVATVQERLGLVALNHLKDVDLLYFNEHLQSAPAQEQLDFFNKSIPDFDGVVVRAMDDFRREFLQK